jgi:hypothetical protein
MDDIIQENYSEIENLKLNEEIGLIKQKSVIDQFKSMQTGVQGGGAGIDDGELMKLKRKIDAMEDKIHDF